MPFRKHHTYREQITRKQSKHRKQITRKRRGGAVHVSVITPQEQQRIFSVTLRTNNDKLSNAILENNEAVMRKFAEELVTTAISSEYLEQKVFQFGPISCKEVLIKTILLLWKDEKNILFNVLMRSAKHRCTHEWIKDVFDKLTIKIKNLYNANESNPTVKANMNNVESLDQYYKDLYNKTISPNMSSNSVHKQIANSKNEVLYGVSHIIAVGYMAVNEDWFTPKNWIHNGIIPTIKPSYINRLLCKMPSTNKNSMTMNQKQNYAVKVIREFLGPNPFDKK